MRFRTDGERVRHDWLQLAVLPPANVGETRVAFAIARRVGSAVRRNRIRRQLRHIFADLAASERQGTIEGDYLVIINRPVPQLSYDQITTTLTAALAKAKLT